MINSQYLCVIIQTVLFLLYESVYSFLRLQKLIIQNNTEYQNKPRFLILCYRSQSLRSWNFDSTDPCNDFPLPRHGSFSSDSLLAAHDHRKTGT